MALVSCPTASIGSVDGAGVAAAVAALPEEVAPGLYACGYAAESSFGAAAWLIRREGGNVLVDSPRAARPLLARLRALGGVTLHFLTHRDDVADHAAIHAALGTERILHTRDVTSGTAGVERRLEGDEPVPLAPDLLAIPVPGHTAGSAALLWRSTYLFTGDHLWAGADGQLEASRAVCWWSWEAQLRSLERLLDLEFSWILPGHGRPARRGSPGELREELAALVRRLRRAA
jgi:glyoxylase-like metal-dependent hydrolase (beta-lactamase superfamily II)